MLNAFVITLREGLEAFLIIAISVAYLRKTGRSSLVPAVRWGILAAIIISVGAGVLFARASNQALWEGVFALIAAVLVAWLTIHMWRAAKTMKRSIEAQVSEAAQRQGSAAFLGIFGFTVFMISREGMETALLMNVLLFQMENSARLVVGAIGGVACAAALAWMWSKHGHRVNLSRFLQVTAVFLLVFVVQLLIYGFHELTEARVLPYSEALHWATEPYGPDGQYGRYFTYLLVGLPLSWLLVSAAFRRRPAPVHPTPRSG